MTDVKKKTKLTARKSCLDSNRKLSRKRTARKSSVRSNEPGTTTARVSGDRDDAPMGSNISSSARSEKKSNKKEKKRRTREVVEIDRDDVVVTHEKPGCTREERESVFRNGEKKRKGKKKRSKKKETSASVQQTKNMPTDLLESSRTSRNLRRLRPVSSKNSAKGEKRRKNRSQQKDRLRKLKSIGVAVVEERSAESKHRRITTKSRPRKNSLSARELSQQRALQKFKKLGARRGNDGGSDASRVPTNLNESSLATGPTSSRCRKPRFRKPSVRSTVGSGSNVVSAYSMGKTSTANALSIRSPVSPPRDRKRFVVLLDLDLTLIHMLRRGVFPKEAVHISEYVFDFDVDETPSKFLDADVQKLQSMCIGHKYNVAVRMGASALVKCMREHKEVDVRVVTANVFGKEIVERIAAIDPHDETSGWVDIPTYVIPNIQKKNGIKTLALSGLPDDALTLSRFIILDDNIDAWHESLRDLVWKMKIFDVLKGKTSLEVSCELQYITRVLGDINVKLQNPTTPKRKAYA